MGVLGQWSEFSLSVRVKDCVCSVWSLSMSRVSQVPQPTCNWKWVGVSIPKKWEICLWGLLAQPFDNAEGWMGAYWVCTDLSFPWHQSWFSKFTQCWCSRAFMSSSKSSLRPPPNPHFANTHWIVVFWPYKWLNSPSLAETKRLQMYWGHQAYWL